MSKVTEAVSRLAKPVAQEEGLELVDVTFTKEGNRFFPPGVY